MSNYTFSSALEEITQINPSFDKARLRVCYTGVNRNKSSISKEVIERAIPTLYYCPVVCNYDIDADEIGGHDVEFVDRNDGLHMVNATNAVGFVPNNAEYGWETVDDHEYLWTECVLWKRAAAYSKIVASGITGQSMEIEINGGHQDDEGVYVIDDFYFTAFCLLGEDIEPCFVNASLQFTLGDAKEQITKMIQEYSSIDIAPSSDGVDIESVGKEDYEMEQEKEIEIVEQTEPIPEEPAENPADEAIEAGEPVGENEPAAEPEAENFELASEMEHRLMVAVESEMYTDADGYVCPRRWFIDFDSSTSEVYYRDSVKGGGLYGATYLMGNDGVIVEFMTEKPKKIAYVDAGAVASTASNDMSSLAPNPFIECSYSYKKACADKDAVIASFQTEKDTMMAELEELRAYRQGKEAEERAAAVAAIYSIFGDLDGNEAFENLKANDSEFTLDQIEEKCYAIRGRMATSAQQAFSLKNNEESVRILVEKTEDDKKDAEPYGGLFTKYPPRI